MIHAESALLRHAQDFFLSDLVGLFSWDHVRIGPPELRPVIPPNADRKTRRREMEAREGMGKYLEQVRVQFRPWELLIYSSMERGPLGEVSLREFDSGREVVVGPLDSATWHKIGVWIRNNSHQRRAS